MNTFSEPELAYLTGHLASGRARTSASPDARRPTYTGERRIRRRFLGGSGRPVGSRPDNAEYQARSSCRRAPCAAS